MGVDSPSNFHAAATNENPNSNGGTTGKKKRGRPKKNEPDGAVSLPVKRGRGRPPMNKPHQPNSKIEMENLGRSSTKMGDCLGSPRIPFLAYPNLFGTKGLEEEEGELVPCSAGKNFTPHVITVAAREVDDTNAEQGGEIHTKHMGVDTGYGGGADREMPLPDHEHVAPDAVLKFELSNPLVEENRLQVCISVAEGVETGATESVAHPNAGALFERHFKAPLNGHEMVGGFSVPSDHVALYTQVWQKYGHIATTKKGTHCPTLAGVVASVLSMIAEMNNQTLATVTGDLLEDWEALMVMSEGLEFNLAWLRQRIDSIKEAEAEMDMIRQEEEDVAAETERIEKLTQDLKARNDVLNKVKEVFSKPLLDGAL